MINETVGKVCAIVVTYNRKMLLRECLDALLDQSYKLDDIVVINNNSDDGTAEFVKGNYPNITVVDLTENTGGAGGFYHGLKWAYKKNYEWYWLMDDDTIPEVNALSELIAASKKFQNLPQKPFVLSSLVYWVDNSLCKLNIPKLHSKIDTVNLRNNPDEPIRIRYCSFVSVLINQKAIEKYGYPIKEYYIWNDDVEYTARILRNEFGFVVPQSKVIHKCATNNEPFRTTTTKFYYGCRNKIWLTKFSDAFSKGEKAYIIIRMIYETFIYLIVNKISFDSLKNASRGIYDGCFRDYHHTS